MIKISKVLLDNLIVMTKTESNTYMESDTLSTKLELTSEELEKDLNSLLQCDRIKMIDDKIYLAEHYKDEYLSLIHI